MHNVFTIRRILTYMHADRADDKSPEITLFDKEPVVAYSLTLLLIATKTKALCDEKQCTCPL
jgi:hypothetical protein